LVKQAEELHAASNFQGVFDLLRPQQETSKDIEVLWRLARAYYDLSDQSTDTTFQKKQLESGLELTERLVKDYADHWASHKWHAIMLATIGDLLSTKERIANSFKIRDHALKSLEIKTGDSTVLHLMGRWCMGVASIGWIERKVASALFGTPPSSSYEEALEFFVKASEIENTIRNSICAGDCCVQLKKRKEAHTWYQTAADLPAPTPKDQLLHDEAVKKAKST